MIWWIWMVAGLVLLILEVLTPGTLFFLFFAVAALLVGALDLVGVVWPMWAELLAFSGLSIASLLLFRGPLVRRMQPSREASQPIDDLSGEMGTSAHPIAPGERGTIELRGTVWQAVNAGTIPMAPQDRCRVLRVEGLTLHVIPEREPAVPAA
jgi:membrane protein implicated in regulation of membrane protease activity